MTVRFHRLIKTVNPIDDSPITILVEYAEEGDEPLGLAIYALEGTYSTLRGFDREFNAALDCETDSRQVAFIPMIKDVFPDLIEALRKAWEAAEG